MPEYQLLNSELKSKKWKREFANDTINVDAKGNCAKVRVLVGGYGANVLDTAKWGKKELAYEIKKERYGYYVVTTFETDNANAINEFNRLVLINPLVLRHIVVNL